MNPVGASYSRPITSAGSRMSSPLSSEKQAASATSARPDSARGQQFVSSHLAAASEDLESIPRSSVGIHVPSVFTPATATSSSLRKSHDFDATATSSSLRKSHDFDLSQDELDEPQEEDPRSQIGADDDESQLSSGT